MTPTRAAAPPPSHDRLLAILIDGARPDLMARLAAAGDLPVLKRHFIDAGGFRTATSVFPSGTEALRSVDLFPTILSALGKPPPPAIDGRSASLSA